MNILINGSSGFIGSVVYNYFKAKQLSIESFSLRNNTTIEIAFKTSIIIHLAGKAHDLKKISNPQEYYEVNTKLTKKVFDAFLASNAKVFITLSSVKAVADFTEEILTENAIPDPQTHYGKSKLLAEEYILANLPKDKRVYILRPCMVHGEGNKGNLTLLYNFIKKGIPYPLGGYNNQRSFLSIDNLCFVMKELIERNDIPSGIYHLADDEPVSTKDLITLMSKVTHKKIMVWNIPKYVIKVIAKIGDFLPLPINTERVVKMTENYVVSNQKIKDALRKELPVSAKDGLRKTIESFEK